MSADKQVRGSFVPLVRNSLPLASSPSYFKTKKPSCWRVFALAGAIFPKHCLWQKKRGEIGSVSQRYAKEDEQTDNETSGRRREPEG